MTKEVTIDDLAMMVQNGFKETHAKMNKGFKEVRDELKSEIGEVKESISFLWVQPNKGTKRDIGFKKTSPL